MSSWLYEPPDSWPYSVEVYRECVAAYLELEWRRCKQDPWYFLRTYPKTKDQLDPQAPFKHFPDLAYLGLLTDLYMTERVVVVAKSRRTIATWHAVAFSLWDCLFYDGRTCGFQNEDQPKANEMIEMADVMYDSLPSWMKARSPVRKKADRMTFTTRHSELIAVPSGPDALRMYTFSRITSDEVGTQKHCPESYKAAKQTITGRSAEKSGQLIYIGTAKDAWFELLAHDKLETEVAPLPLWKKQLLPEAEPPLPHPPHWGMEVVRQASSEYLTVFLHHTADPEKRTPAWKAFARKGIPQEDWAQEMDIDFKAKSGKKALAVFDRWRHKIVVPWFKPPAWWPRWSSHDYGLTNPYSCHFYTMAPDRTIYAYWEYYSPGPLGIHLEKIRKHEDFPKLRDKILDSTAWTAWNQSTTTNPEGLTSHMVKSIAQMHEDVGFDMIPASKQVQDRVKIEIYLRHWNEDVMEAGGEPTFKIMDNCDAFLDEIPGIRWKKVTYQAQLDGEVSEKLVDAKNHAFDDGSYALLHLEQPGIEPVVVHQTIEDVHRAMRQEMAANAYADATEEAEQMQQASEEYFSDGLD